MVLPGDDGGAEWVSERDKVKVRSRIIVLGICDNNDDDKLGYVSSNTGVVSELVVFGSLDARGRSFVIPVDVLRVGPLLRIMPMSLSYCCLIGT